MAVLAGIGLAEGWRIRSRLIRLARAQPQVLKAIFTHGRFDMGTLAAHHPPISDVIMATVAPLLTVGLLGNQIGQYAAYKQEHPGIARMAPNPIARQIQELTAPNDCIVTDSSKLALFSERMIPLSLTEVSRARLESGNLSCAELVAETEVNGLPGRGTSR